MKENKSTEAEVIKIYDILAKWEFILGQRAGRELWVDKPERMKEEDLKNFRRDIEAVKKLIDRLQAENENYSHNNNELTKSILAYQKALKQAKAEAYKEFFQLIHKEFVDISNGYFESKNIDACVVMQGAIDKLRETYKGKVGEEK